MRFRELLEKMVWKLQQKKFSRFMVYKLVAQSPHTTVIFDQSSKELVTLEDGGIIRWKPYRGSVVTNGKATGLRLLTPLDFSKLSHETHGDDGEIIRFFS